MENEVQTIWSMKVTTESWLLYIIVEDVERKYVTWCHCLHPYSSRGDGTLLAPSGVWEAREGLDILLCSVLSSCLVETHDISIIIKVPEHWLINWGVLPEYDTDTLHYFSPSLGCFFSPARRQQWRAGTDRRENACKKQTNGMPSLYFIGYHNEKDVVFQTSIWETHIWILILP